MTLQSLRATLLALPPDRTLTSGELLRMAGSAHALERARSNGLVFRVGNRWGFALGPVVVRAATERPVADVVTGLRESGLYDVVSRVCDAYGVTVEDVVARDRTSNVSAARMAAYAALWELPGRRLTLADIARAMGRSKACVHEGIGTHARRMAAPRKAGERVRGGKVAA